MKTGEKVFWRRFSKDSGSRAAIRVPAVFIGFCNKDRETATVFALADGTVEKRNVKAHNLLPRDTEKEIDTAIIGRAFYNGRALTGPQMLALKWLRANDGLEVLNMSLEGRSKEWPTHRTLEGLQERGLIDVEQHGTYWRCSLNDLGNAILKEEENA